MLFFVHTLPETSPKEVLMPPTWLVVVAWCALAIAVASAGVILGDIFVRGYRQPMRVMEAVWPITALYFGPLAVWVYWRYARRSSPRWLDEQGLSSPPDHPKWVTTAIGVSHCGAGCTLGDIIAEFVIFALAIQLLGSMLLAEYVGDYVAALALGILFQYWALAPMRGLNFRDGIGAAAKADVLSLTAFEIGLFGWMAIMVFVLFPSSPLHPTTPVYWFLMQIGMILGFATSWPANVWLIRKGITEAM